MKYYNKELFKKYWDSFEYYIKNDGKVWFRKESEVGEWWLTDNPIFTEGYIYVPDDEYAELRKALFDGKSVEVNRNSILGKVGYDWREIEKSDMWVFPPHYYRIKPEDSDWWKQLDGTVEKGVWCRVWSKATSTVRLIVDRLSQYEYVADDGAYWENAEPLTREEIMSHIYTKGE